MQDAMLYLFLCIFVVELLVNCFSCTAVDIALTDGVEWACLAAFVCAVVTVIAGAGKVLAILAGCLDSRKECWSIHNRYDLGLVFCYTVLPKRM
jgi:hypothetical protein